MTAAPERPRGADWQSFVDGVRGYVARRVPASDADDVAQEIFLRLHRGAASLRDDSRAQAWVFGIARRAIADYYRGRGAVPANVDEVAGLEADTTTPGVEPWAHEAVLSWLRPMAESLPDGYREALLMADFEGRPQREVAAALGLSLSGAKSRVQRARRMLADQLRRCCEIEFDGDGRVVDYRTRVDPCC